ncbi:MAG TPA: hypothetical protein VNB22_22400 [Pyrinomonadaceae bacterium]|nr:hypothetical protein [Pyrinomonadaceae bacterium]
MKTENKKIIITLWLLASIFWQAIPVRGQQTDQMTAITPELNGESGAQIYKNLLRQGSAAEFPELLEKIFGSEADAAAETFDEGAEQLFQAVSNAASEKADARLEKEIEERREKRSTNPIIAPNVKTNPAIKRPVKSKKLSFNIAPQTNWRQFAFGFQPLPPQDENPDIKTTETDKEIKAEGTDKKSFETKDAKGTRTQKAETRYIKDGKTFGIEIRDTQIIEAVSKPDGKNFRKEISLAWGAQVAACPDASGVSAGTGMAKIVSKTIYTEGGATVTMTSEFDLQAKLVGYVNDQAELTRYDLQLDAYTTNSGYEDALRRNLIKEIKIKDGRYGLHYDIAGNTIEVSDGTYGGKRTPAKLGKVTAHKLIPMTDAETTVIGSAIGPMVPSIWNSANEMYKSAERNWKNYGCVEVVCKVPKTTLKAGEEISISTETVHLQDGSKINAQMTAEGYRAQISPESQAAKPNATFTFIQDGEENSSFHVESISKRGIGRGDVDFETKKEKEETAENGVWTGTIKAERKQREEKEKRSGANLAENGGYLETVTNVQLQLTGKLDRTVDATNAYIADVTGTQEMVDFEYDKYKVDEGYCGVNAVPYKGPKEITRTSTTTVNYNKETRVFVEIGATGGTLTFSLPEITGTTVHKYVHKSPCADHDRANTNQATNEDAPTVGGSFSFSLPVDPSQKTIKGTLTVREDGGGTTVYTWELSRR